MKSKDEVSSIIQTGIMTIIFRFNMWNLSILSRGCSKSQEMCKTKFRSLNIYEFPACLRLGW